jgi:hypothetical protein
MTKAELEVRRLALLAEGDALLKAYDRLRLTPADRSDHAEHRHRIRMHDQCVRSYLQDLQRRADN